MKSILALIVALSALFVSHAVAANAKPNIIFFLADDLGRGDLHCYGHPYAHAAH